MAQLTIAIPKGRLEAETLGLFTAAGFRLDPHRDPRQLACCDESGKGRFIFVKPADVPVYVEHGISVTEVIAESSAQLVVNRASYQLKATVIAELISALKGALPFDEVARASRP